MNAIMLIAACAQDTGSNVLWYEFLARYGVKIKQFINRACYMEAHRSCNSWQFKHVTSTIQQSDLFQNTIVRLIENDCALMKRFSGNTEMEWLVYLAVIVRSTVANSFRKERRQHRRDIMAARMSTFLRTRNDCGFDSDRKLLADEVEGLCERLIVSGDQRERDLYVFRMYFIHDQSTGRIASCKALGLSRTGVQRVIRHLLKRLVRITSEKRAYDGSTLAKRRSSIVFATSAVENL